MICSSARTFNFFYGWIYFRLWTLLNNKKKRVSVFKITIRLSAKMMNAIQCIRSTVQLVPIKLNGSYSLPYRWHKLSQIQRMSSTHTHKQLTHKPEQLEQQQHQSTSQPQQQFVALNHNHVSVIRIRMK